MKFSFRLFSAALIATLAMMSVGTSPATAHTGFESSEPADGADLGAPLSVVTLVFSGDAEPTGGGFQILDPSGEVRLPAEASTADGRTWVLRFDPPLGGGTIGVRWNVKAPDAHPIDGAFSFTTPEVANPQDPPIVAESATGSDSTLDGRAVTRAGSEEQRSLNEFLNSDSDPGLVGSLGVAGRALTILGTLIGLGGMAFAIAVMRGTRREVVEVVWWIKRAGPVIIVGAMLDYLGQVASQAGDASAVWSLSAQMDVAGSSYGLAIGLRLVGGLALAATQLQTAAVSSVPLKARERVSVLVGGAGASEFSDVPVRPTHSGRSSHRWIWERSIGAFAGAFLILVSFLFHGHTVSKGDRLITGIADMVHVGGAAVWAGGVFILATVLLGRKRSGVPLDVRRLAARFSVVATVAIGLVGVAGVALTVIILDAPSELWATPWGRLLIIKALLVAVALAGGAYNHRVLVPALNHAPDDLEVVKAFRTVVSIEASVLAVVAVVTAFLIGAAS